MKSELCESCVHTNVCGKDKNLFGDVFVMGHPSFFDNDELFQKFKEREAAGFPCDDYMQERKRGKWLDATTLGNEFICWVCSECRHGADFVYDPYNFCPNCGADMRGYSNV